MAARRNGTGWFKSAQIAQLYEEFRIEPPSISGNLSHLRSAGHLVQRGRPGRTEWALTPEGREELRAIVEGIDYAELVAEEAELPGAEFLHAHHTVLAPTYAPAKYAPGIARLHERVPFERSVFCMTRFPDQDDALPDPVRAAVERLESVVGDHGLVLHVATTQLDDDLFTNVGAYMWGCQYGIGLLEDRADEGLNYNVIAELGSMLTTGRRCAFLKDRTAPALPTDFVGQIYKPVDLDDLDGLAGTVHRWLAGDLVLGRCPSCP